MKLKLRSQRTKRIRREREDEVCEWCSKFESGATDRVCYKKCNEIPILSFLRYSISLPYFMWLSSYIYSFIKKK